MTAITGYVSNLIGGYFSDFVMIAAPARNFYSATGGLVTTTPVSFPASSGFLDFELPETTTAEVLVAFTGTYTANGIFNEIFFTPTLIPDVASIGIEELLNPINN